MRLLALSLIAALSFGMPALAQSVTCGDADTPCTVPGGTY